jgi:hypothetical protein
LISRHQEEQQRSCKNSIPKGACQALPGFPIMPPRCPAK